MKKEYLPLLISYRQDKKTWPEITCLLRKYFPSDVSEPNVMSRLKRAYYSSEAYRQNFKAVNPEPKIEPRELTEVEASRASTSMDRNGNFTSDRLIEIFEEEELTPVRLLELHRLTPVEKWKIISYKNNLWHSQRKGGKLLLHYQSTVVVKPKDEYIDHAFIENFFGNLDRQYVTHSPSHKCIKVGTHMAEVNIADLHLGKFYYDEQSNTVYDSETSKQIWFDLVDKIYHELQTKCLDYITFVWCNDFFNSDTVLKTTFAGTPQDTDLEWNRLFNLGVELLISAIDTLSKLAPVKTFYTPSNHDLTTGYYAVKYLEAWFKNNDNIEIDSTVYPYKYTLYGNTLIGYSHGDTKDTTTKKLAGMMPVEVPELWAKSLYREFHIAHLHSEHLIEELNGVLVRRISSPTFSDNWHIKHRFIGSVRKAQTFLYDKEHGLTTIINTPVLS